MRRKNIRHALTSTILAAGLCISNLGGSLAVYAEDIPVRDEIQAQVEDADGHTHECDDPNCTDHDAHDEEADTVPSSGENGAALAQESDDNSSRTELDANTYDSVEEALNAADDSADQELPNTGNTAEEVIVETETREPGEIVIDVPDPEDTSDGLVPIEVTIPDDDVDVDTVIDTSDTEENNAEDGLTPIVVTVAEDEEEVPADTSGETNVTIPENIAYSVTEAEEEISLAGTYEKGDEHVSVPVKLASKFKAASQSTKAFTGKYGDQLTGSAKMFYTTFVKHYITNSSQENCEITYDSVDDSPFLFDCTVTNDAIDKTTTEYKNYVSDVKTAVQSAWDALNYDYPEKMWMVMASFNYQTSRVSEDNTNWTGYLSKITLKPVESFDGAKELQDDFESALTSTVSTIKKSADYDQDGTVTDLEFIIATDEYLSKRLEYDASSYDASAGNYSVFCAAASVLDSVDNGVVCEGYARSFASIMHEYGLACCLIGGYIDPGSTSEEGHMWNAVKLDGSWYAVDVTFDDLDYANATTGRYSTRKTLLTTEYDGRSRDGNFSESQTTTIFNYPTLATSNYEYSITNPPTTLVCGSGDSNLTLSTAGAFTKNTAADEHSYTVTKEVAATETKDGSKTYTCSTCGNTYTETVEYSADDSKKKAEGSDTETEKCADGEHDYTVTDTKNATCTEDGSKTYTCSKCSDTYTETLEKTGHSYEVTDEKAATATEDGYTTYTCTSCGDTYTDTIPATGEEETTEVGIAYYSIEIKDQDGNSLKSILISKTLDGEYSESELKSLLLECKEEADAEYNQYMKDNDLAVDSASTFEVPIGSTTEDGVTTYKYRQGLTVVVKPIDDTTCTDGGEHTYTSETKDATCTDEGSITYTCSVCGHSYSVTLGATGHTYEEVTDTATCTEDGIKSYVCSVCGATYEEESLATGHDYQETAHQDATCENAGYTTYVCTKCGDRKEDYLHATGHKYEETGESEATCTDYACVTYVCSVCGKEYVDIIEDEEPLGHDYQATAESKETCLTGGEVTYVCSRCGDTYTETIEAPGHSYEITEHHDADCTTGAYDIYTCKVCGDTFQTYTSSVGDHNYVAGEVVAPTCVSTGYTVYTCSVCGKTENRDFTEKTSHNYEKVTGTGATCTESGADVYVCTYCGDRQEMNFQAALGHNYVEKVIAPTCTTDGYTAKVCSRCGTEVRVSGSEVSATGHNWTTSTVAPTCTEQGYDLKKCENCGAEERTNFVKSIGHHNYVVTETVKATAEEAGYTVYTCTVCGDSYTSTEAPKGHNWVLQKRVDATCTEAGYKEYACADDGCTETYQSEIPATGHTYTTTTVEATCTTPGYILHTCKTCGDSYKTDYTDVAEHDYAVKTVAATCESAGYKEYVCRNCGDTYKEESKGQLGHKFVDKVTAPTCTEDGYTTHTCARCGEVVTDTIVPATDHNFEEYTVNPSCTTKGYTLEICSVCGYTNELGTTEAKGHTYTDTITKAATCTKNGIMTHTCSVCGDSYTEVIPATGHSYESEKVEGSCTEDAYTKHTCTVCGDTYTDEITTAPGHNFETVSTKATCDTDGTTTYTCKECGYTYTVTDGEATGHEYTYEHLDPTCTDYGYTIATCKTCGYSYTEELFGPLGHNWVLTVVKPTVAEGGYTTHTCSRCGKTYNTNFTEAKTLKTPSFTSAKFKKSGKAVLTWKKVTGITRYEIQYSTNKDFTDAKSVKPKRTTVKKTITGLEKGKTYYFRIRSYKKLNGQVYYSDWSSTKKVLIKK